MTESKNDSGEISLAKAHIWAEVQYEWATKFAAPDTASIRSLLNHTIQDEGILGYPQTPSKEQFSAFIRNINKEIREGLTHALVARSEGTIVGMVLLRRSSMPTCQHRAEICKAVIAPIFRGVGIVLLAFEILQRRAMDIGVDSLTIDVREDSRAHQLWTAMGFQTYGVLEDYARYAGRSFRGHFMAYKIRRHDFVEPRDAILTENQVKAGETC